jgi:hypothetical protein
MAKALLGERDIVVIEERRLQWAAEVSARGRLLQ